MFLCPLYIYVCFKMLESIIDKNKISPVVDIIIVDLLAIDDARYRHSTAVHWTNKFTQVIWDPAYRKLFKNYLLRPQSQSNLYGTIYNFWQTIIDRIKTSKYLSPFLWPWPQPKGKVTCPVISVAAHISWGFGGLWVTYETIYNFWQSDVDRIDINACNTHM